MVKKFVHQTPVLQKYRYLTNKLPHCCRLNLHVLAPWLLLWHVPQLGPELFCCCCLLLAQFIFSCNRDDRLLAICINTVSCSAVNSSDCSILASYEARSTCFSFSFSFSCDLRCCFCEYRLLASAYCRSKSAFSLPQVACPFMFIQQMLILIHNRFK